jgi:hypothetical protein
MFLGSLVSPDKRKTQLAEQDSIDILKEIRDTLNSDKYEYSDPITIGGGTGSYAAASPYNTECEWCLVSVSCGLLAGGSFAVGSGQTQPTLFVQGTQDKFGSVASGGRDSFNGLPSYVGQLQTSNPLVTFPTIWQPISMPPIIYATVTVNSQSEVLVTVQFRRLLLRLVPDKPRQRPSTHSHPQSRGSFRRLAAMSPMASGFESRTVVGSPYEQAGIPTIPERNSGKVPISQDTANNGVQSQGTFLMGRNNKKRG